MQWGSHKKSKTSALLKSLILVNNGVWLHSNNLRLYRRQMIKWRMMLICPLQIADMWLIMKTWSSCRKTLVLVTAGKIHIGKNVKSSWEEAAWKETSQKAASHQKQTIQQFARSIKEWWAVIICGESETAMEENHHHSHHHLAPRRCHHHYYADSCFLKWCAR